MEEKNPKDATQQNEEQKKEKKGISKGWLAAGALTCAGLGFEAARGFKDVKKAYNWSAETIKKGLKKSDNVTIEDIEVPQYEQRFNNDRRNYGGRQQFNKH